MSNWILSEIVSFQAYLWRTLFIIVWDSLEKYVLINFLNQLAGKFIKYWLQIYLLSSLLSEIFCIHIC